MIILPGGNLSVSNMPVAAQAALVGVGRAPARRRKRANGKTSARRTTKRKTKRRTSAKAAKFVKGSAAAKRHMAKLRRMRRR